MNNHISNKKVIATCLLVLMGTNTILAEEILYPATIENSSQETYFVPAPKYVEEAPKKTFNFKFWQNDNKKEKNLEFEKAPTENEIEEKVAEEIVDNEEAKNSLKTKGETWKKTKDKYHKVMNSEDEYGKLGEQNLKGIQETIKNEEIFQHETSNKVYLDRFNTILDEDSQAFYQGKRIEEKAGELEVMTEDGKPSIYDLIREIENSDPTNASAEPIKISLDDCIGIAIAKHPSILSAQLTTDIYKSRIVQAWSSYFPSLSLGVEYARMYSKVPDYSYGLNSAYFPNASAGLLLFDFGKTKASVDIAKTDYSMSKFDLQNSVNEIVYSVKSAYYNLLFAQKQIEIYETTIEEFELHLKAAQKYFAIGKKPQVDVAIAEYNVGSAKLNLVKAKNSYEVAKVTLANTLGLPEFANFELSENLTKQEYKDELESLLEDAFTIRPDLLSYQKSVESSLLAVRKAKRDFAPDLMANGSIYRGGADPMKETNYNVGVNLSYSGTNLLNLKQELEIAKKSYEKSLTDYENKRQSVYLEVKDAFINMNNSKETVKQAELNVEQAKAQHYHATGRYKAGLGDAIELKDSENTYMNAQLEYYQSLLDYNNDVANLERVVGRPIVATDEVL